MEFFWDKLIKSSYLTISHGDFCFSNILIDEKNYTFKLVDPRGIINSKNTIYNDFRYDIAKLRHSAVGGYDYIVCDMFSVWEMENNFKYQIYSSEQKNLKEIFNKLLIENNYDVKEIEFIEGLLFLSMIPLHSDNFLRQKMFYLKGIEILNNVLFDKEKKGCVKEKNSEFVSI